MITIYYIHIYIRIKIYRVVEGIITLNILIETEGMVVGRK